MQAAGLGRARSATGTPREPGPAGRPHGGGGREVGADRGRLWRWRLVPGSLAAALLVAGGSGLLQAPPAGAQAGGFTVTGSMQTARADATATVLANGNVLVAGGENASGTPLASAELYRPSSGTWTTTGSLPLPVSQATATVLANGDVLVAGGLTVSSSGVAPTGASELYDPSTGRWSATTGDLQTASFGASAAALSSGQVLYAGGLTGTESSASATAAAELYDPSTSTWSTTGSLPLPVAFAASARLTSGAVLVAGGETGASAGLTALAEVYSASTHAWSAVDHLPTAVASATTSRLASGDVLVAGGETSTGGTSTGVTQRFDPTSGHWTSVGSLPFASYEATATRLSSGQVLYAAGLTSSAGAPTARTALYSSSSATWAAGPDLQLARGDAVAAALANGGALVASGRTSSGVTGEAERLTSGTAPTITTPASASLRAGVYATVTIRATGTPTPTLSASGVLPPGMAFRAGTDGTATISGTPHPGSVTTYTVTITASNGVGSPAVQRLALTFQEAPAFTSPASRTLRAGVYTSFAVTTTGTPTPRLVVRGTLPPDLRFRDNGNGTATISGVARSGLTGTYHVTITASNGVGSPAVQYLTLTFQQPPAFTTPSSLTVREGSQVHFTIRASGVPSPMLSLQGTLPRYLAFRAGTGGTATISGGLAAGVRGTFTVRVTAANGVGSPVTQTLRITVTPVANLRGSGYWYTTSTGQVIGKGSARPIAPRTPQRPREIVGMAAMPDGNGYYLVSSYGGVFNYGNAPFYGSIAARHLRTRTAAIAVVPAGNGYYEATRAGNVFAFGTARFRGSTAGRRLPPIAALALTPDGRGYWLVTTRGNIYAFGDARFHGSPARLRIATVVGLAPTPSGRGYWVATVNGGVLAYGDARSYGSLAGRRIPPVSAFAATRTGRGYWIVTRAGNVFDEGDATFHGSSARTRLDGPVTGFAPDF